MATRKATTLDTTEEVQFTEETPTTEVTTESVVEDAPVIEEVKVDQGHPSRDFRSGK